MQRTDWTEPGASSALCWLAIDDRKGNPRRHNHLPYALYSDIIAPFLHFDAPLPNQLYAVGGRNQQQGPLDDVEMLDTWHGEWVPCPKMSVRRAGCSAAVLDDGQILAVGGYDEKGIVRGLLASCEAFDPKKQQWDTGIAPLQRARWGHGCVTLGGLVYAVGGCSLRAGAPPREAFMETLRSCEVYDPQENRWSPSADLKVARAGSRVVTLGERFLAAVGGCDDVFGRAEMLPTVELLDAAAGVWSLLVPRLAAPRTTAAVTALDDRRVLVVGGAPSLASAEVYQVPTPENSRGMDEGPSMPNVCDMAEGRMGCQAVTIDLPPRDGKYPLCSRQCVVVVGGENGDEDWDYEDAQVRQFSSALVYDVEDEEWLPEGHVPPMPRPCTAMALCVGPGRIRGHP